jgi:hypothetical protein
MSSTKELPTGCDACRKGAYSGSWPPPQRIAVREDGPTFLHRCELCGTYWDFDLRFANPVTEEKAKTIYPDYFKE